VKSFVWLKDEAPKETLFLIHISFHIKLGLKSVINIKKKNVTEGGRGQKSVTYYLNGPNTLLHLFKMLSFHHQNDPWKRRVNE
jgi:hypothetical protein